MIPPIEVYRIGDLHFVKDGHHRVSVAIATGQEMIDADVTEVLTQLPATGISRHSDLTRRLTAGNQSSRTARGHLREHRLLGRVSRCPYHIEDSSTRVADLRRGIIVNPRPT